ncbi:hypothetical protein [Aurantimonas coralicida]|uniref:hypothetical protein n=1 Tax=Aurantimonas coralicida TaxID=182270 RepID=UPI001D1966B2|nr:hypothetical protein [Aurantimonas coralicida]MCC4298560.1 hypothetical protein [Aurantimonas coralicida]
MENAIDITLAIVLPLLATVLTTIAIPAAIAWLKANNVIKDEARAKLLQSALENAALTAIARAGGARVVPAVTSDAAGAAIAYVKASVPDTVKHLGLSDSQIAALVVPHIQRQIDKVKL